MTSSGPGGQIPSGWRRVRTARRNEPVPPGGSEGMAATDAPASRMAIPGLPASTTTTTAAPTLSRLEIRCTVSLPCLQPLDRHTRKDLTGNLGEWDRDPIMAPSRSCSTASASPPTVEIIRRVTIVLWWTVASVGTLSLIRSPQEILGMGKSHEAVKPPAMPYLIWAHGQVPRRTATRQPDSARQNVRLPGRACSGGPNCGFTAGRHFARPRPAYPGHRRLELATA